MALSENVNHLVYIVDNDLISISALNTDGSEAIESMLLNGVSKLKEHCHRSFAFFSFNRCWNLYLVMALASQNAQMNSETYKTNGGSESKP